MNRRMALAGIGGSIAAALAGCAAELPGDSIARSFEERHAVPEEAVVAVTNRNGAVSVSETDEDQLVLSGQKRARTQTALDSIRIETISGERFVVDVRFESGYDDSNRAVDLDVGVPNGVRVDRAYTGNGPVTVDGIAGDVQAGTVNGDVEVTNVSGFVRGETNNGDVTVGETTGLLGARTGNGEVDVELRRMREDVTCRSSNGPVAVRVGRDVSAALSLSTNTGTVSIEELEYTATTDRSDYVVGSLRGGDSPLLWASTTNGDVRLQSIDD